MEALQGITVTQFMAVLAALIPGLVWLIRLEGVVKFQRREIDDLRDGVGQLRVKHEALDSKMFEKLASIEVKLGKIEGYLFEHDKR